MTNEQKGTLLIIGGGEDRSPGGVILRTLADLVGKGPLVISTVASEEPEDLAKEYTELFGRLGIREVRHLDVATREEAMDEQTSAVLDHASGVFFTGGDQLRITSRIGDTPTFRRLVEIYDRGGVVAGTSAGASVMSETMLVSGSGEDSPRIGRWLQLAPGFGLLSDVIIDQHFAQRGRLNRLLASVAQNPRIMGLGLDENTAVVVHGEEWFEVIGEGAVYVIDGREITYSNLVEGTRGEILSVQNVRMHVLASGDELDLLERSPRRRPEGKPIAVATEPGAEPRVERARSARSEDGRS